MCPPLIFLPSFGGLALRASRARATASGKTAGDDDAEPARACETAAARAHHFYSGCQEPDTLACARAPGTASLKKLKALRVGFDSLEVNTGDQPAGSGKVCSKSGLDRVIARERQHHGGVWRRAQRSPRS